MMDAFKPYLASPFTPTAPDLRSDADDVPSYHNVLKKYGLYLNPTKRPDLSLAELKKVSTQLLWPRLIALRVRNVLAALLTLFQQTPNSTLYSSFTQLSYAINLLGWALHGLRLLINTLELLQHTLPGIWMTEAEKQQGWQERFNLQFNRTWTEFGSDLIWIFSTLAPTTLSFTLATLAVDLLWVGCRAWIEIERLTTKSRHHEESRHAFNPEHPPTDASIEHEWLKKHIAHEQKKLALSVLQLISISSIFILKSFVCPIITPALASNPLFLLCCASLVLTITLANHYLAKQLALQKPPDLEDIPNPSQQLVIPGSTFFQPATKKPLNEPMDELHMLTI